ncbi:MAG: flagellar basal body P-ring formation chaperone FlgA [Sulfurimonadaceae bacterium]|jgi:flagella basal body P-ring formation protein FlgA|nr:flagellar basal body P-ring formation chaperone FlgA [Sulfurimonadaceae bacterium]
MRLFIILFFLITTLFAQKNIPPVIYVDSDDIFLSHLIKNPQEDKKIASIYSGKYTLKIKSTDLLALLAKNGYKEYKTQSRYIRFVKKSPINTAIIEEKIKNFYLSHYPSITIERIDVFPRGFISELPEHYNVTIDPRSSISNEGIFHIDTLDHKKIFFDYSITANLTIYKTKTDIKRDAELNGFNLIEQKVFLESFRDIPFAFSKDTLYQAKYNIKANEVITMRDVVPLTLIERGSKVSVTMINESMDIQFSAKALQDGKLNDIITIENNNKKKIRAKVIGKNKVEMQ